MNKNVKNHSIDIPLPHGVPKGHPLFLEGG